MPTHTDCPLGATVTLDELTDDVHMVNHRLRSTEPVSFIPAINAWLVTRYDDASTVMRDAVTYTVDHPSFTTAQVVGPTMLSLDGNAHKQHRKPFEQPFRRRDVKTRFNDKVADEIANLLDELSKREHGDLLKEYAGPIAVLTMQTALGMEDISTVEALAFNDDIIDAVTRLTAGEPLGKKGGTAIAALRESLTPELNADPASSILAAATAHMGNLSEEELLANAAILLIGGIETTEGMIANAFYHLLSTPDMLARVRADLSLVPKVIEESLRMEPAAGVVDRFATVDVLLRNAEIKKGDLVRVSLNGANRDPSVFPVPDTFDVFRPNLRSHVTFAHGPHVCLGLHLARLETAHAIEQALVRLPNLRLDPDHLAQAQPTGLVFRKPNRLQARWR